MESFTFWASIASILGLAAAVWAAIKAHGAKKAAEQARNELRRQQILPLSFHIENLVTLVDAALKDRSWAACERQATWAFSQVVELWEYLREQLSNEEHFALANAAKGLQEIAASSLHFAQPEAAEPSHRKYQSMAARMMDVRQAVAKLKGMARRRLNEE